MLYRTKNKKICERIWVFNICEKIQKTINGYWTGCFYKAAKHLGNKIADAVTKSNGDHIVKQKRTSKRR